MTNDQRISKAKARKRPRDPWGFAAGQFGLGHLEFLRFFSLVIGYSDVVIDHSFLPAALPLTGA